MVAAADEFILALNQGDNPYAWHEKKTRIISSSLGHIYIYIYIIQNDFRVSREEKLGGNSKLCDKCFFNFRHSQVILLTSSSIVSHKKTKFIIIFSLLRPLQ